MKVYVDVGGVCPAKYVLARGIVLTAPRAELCPPTLAKWDGHRYSVTEALAKKSNQLVYPGPLQMHAHFFSAPLNTGITCSFKNIDVWVPSSRLT